MRENAASVAGQLFVTAVDLALRALADDDDPRRRQDATECQRRGDPDPTLHRVLRELQYIRERLETMSGTLDALTTQVANSDQVMASAATLIQGLADQVRAAGTDPAKLQALVTDLQTNSSALAAAVAANTPAQSGGGGADTTGGAQTGGTDTGVVGGPTGSEGPAGTPAA